jgi:hypothetical protein
MAPRLITRLGLAVAVLAAVGCSSSVKRPNWFNPGSAGYQRYEATQGVDPYPLPDLGPDVVGSRPRDFRQPVPEVERARQYTEGARVSAVPRPASGPVALPPVTTMPAGSYPPAAFGPPMYGTPSYTAPPVYSQP